MRQAGRYLPGINYGYFLSKTNAFSALAPLVWRQEKHPACKNWLMSCWWCGYLPGARCILFAIWSNWCHCIPKPHLLLPHLIPDWFYLSGTGLPRLSWNRGRNMCSSSSICQMRLNSKTVGQCTGWAKKTGPQGIESWPQFCQFLTDLRICFSLEDSLVNLQLKGYQKPHRTLHMLLHYFVKH